MKIAVLLTTFNRKQKTVACLRSLLDQELADTLQLEVFLTDDDSADDTADAVKSIYPGINIYHGNGSFFWAGGMRNSWEKALGHDFDYYLLLNDDTILNKKAIRILLQSSKDALNKYGRAAICIGSTVDSATGGISYGGRRLTSKIRLRSYMVHSETENVECDLGNANIMLVPRQVVQKVGILSQAFTHSIADYDYTLRAKKAGFIVLVAPGILGSCIDDHGNNWKSQQVSLKERIQYLKSPKGLAYKEYLRFMKDHFPLSYPAAFCKLWMKTLFPFVWETFKK